jgi:hypothetical protein
MTLPDVNPFVGVGLIVVYFGVVTEMISRRCPAGFLVVAMLIALLFVLKWTMLSSRCAFGVIESKLRGIPEHKSLCSRAIHSSYVMGLAWPWLIPTCILICGGLVL